ncbi:hypothetical protein D3C72_1312590 [compost metagenome]
MTGGGQGQDQRRDDQGRRERRGPFPAAPVCLDPAPAPGQQVDRRVQGGRSQQALDLVRPLDPLHRPPGGDGLGQIGLDAQRQFAPAQSQIGAEEGGGQHALILRLRQDQAVGDHDVGAKTEAGQIVAPRLQQRPPRHGHQPPPRRRHRPQDGGQPVGGRREVVAQQVQRRRRHLRRTARRQLEPAHKHVGAGNHGDIAHRLGRISGAELQNAARQHDALRIQRKA